MIVLDVACGAGHVAEDVAPHVRQVVGVDLTPALLEVGRARIREKGIENVLLQLGNAAELPFVDGSFDVVFCRSALHHFADPSAQVAEMARVCRPSGRVAVLDMVPPTVDVRESFDRVHRQIDPSHAAVLIDTEISALLESAVGPVKQVAPSNSITIPLEIMLTDLSQTDVVLEALHAELDGGAPTGLEPVLDEDRLLVTARTTVMHATRLVSS